MATTSLWPINKTINNTIEYVENKDKTQIPISDLSNTIDYASNKNPRLKAWFLSLAYKAYYWQPTFVGFLIRQSPLQLLLTRKRVFIFF